MRSRPRPGTRDPAGRSAPGVPIASAEFLLTRMRAKIDDERPERDCVKRAVDGKT